LSGGNFQEPADVVARKFKKKREKTCRGWTRERGGVVEVGKGKGDFRKN